MGHPPTQPLVSLLHALRTLILVVGAPTVGGMAVAYLLRRWGLRWTWAALGLPVAYLLLRGDRLLFACSCGVSLLACLLGASWHRSDLEHGADLADSAHVRLGFRGTSAAG